MPWPGGGVSAPRLPRLPGLATLVLSLLLGLSSSLSGVTPPTLEARPAQDVTRGRQSDSQVSDGRSPDSDPLSWHSQDSDPHSWQSPHSDPSSWRSPISDPPSYSTDHADIRVPGPASRHARSVSNDSLSQLSQLSSHSLTQCLPSLQSESAALTAGHICSCADTAVRLRLTLHNPNPVFTSQCWDQTPSHRDYCLPPVLTPSELANIESPEAGVCEDQAGANILQQGKKTIVK